MQQFELEQLYDQVGIAIRVLTGFNPARVKQRQIRNGETPGKLIEPHAFKLRPVSKSIDRMGRQEAQDLLDALHTVRQMLNVIMAEQQDQGGLNTKAVLRDW